MYVDCIGVLLDMGAPGNLMATMADNAAVRDICRGVLTKLLPQVVTVLVKAVPEADGPGVREGIVRALGVAVNGYGIPPQQLITGLAQTEVQWLQSVLF